MLSNVCLELWSNFEIKGLSAYLKCDFFLRGEGAMLFIFLKVDIAVTSYLFAIFEFLKKNPKNVRELK